MNNKRDILAGAAEDMGITLTDRAMDLFAAYARELLFWNNKMSLISLKSPHDLTKHLIDSLTPGRLITDGQTLLDIGAGGGLPGIPLKLVRESLRVTLLESSRKKSSFLKSVIRTLGLRDISVINERAESFLCDTHRRGSFDVVISRATFQLAHLLTIGEPFLTSTGTLIAMKGSRAYQELEEATDAMRQTGLIMTDSHKITLPITGESRILICFGRDDDRVGAAAERIHDRLRP